jgi:hypothetical protein
MDLSILINKVTKSGVERGQNKIDCYVNKISFEKVFGLF